MDCFGWYWLDYVAGWVLPEAGYNDIISQRYDIVGGKCGSAAAFCRHSISFYQTVINGNPLTIESVM